MYNQIKVIISNNTKLKFKGVEDVYAISGNGFLLEVLSRTSYYEIKKRSLAINSFSLITHGEVIKSISKKGKYVVEMAFFCKSKSGSFSYILNVGFDDLLLEEYIKDSSRILKVIVEKSKVISLDFHKKDKIKCLGITSVSYVYGNPLNLGSFKTFTKEKVTSEEMDKMIISKKKVIKRVNKIIL